MIWRGNHFLIRMAGVKRKDGAHSNRYKAKRARTMGSTRPAVRTMVAREILRHSEFKQSVTSNAATGTNSTTTGTVVQLNSNIAQGDDVTNRTGRQISTLYVDVQYAYFSQVALATVNFGAQVALVYDGQPDGAAPAYSTIFDANGGTAGMSFKDTANNKERFKIFWMDELPTDNGSADPTTYMQRKRHFVDLRKNPSLSGKDYSVTRFGGTGAVVPTIGAWYLCFGDSTNSTTTAKIMYIVKYCYTDH